MQAERNFWLFDLSDDDEEDAWELPGIRYYENLLKPAAKSASPHKGGHWSNH